MNNPGREAIRNILSAITHHVIAVSSSIEDGRPFSTATALAQSKFFRNNFFFKINKQLESDRQQWNLWTGCRKSSSESFVTNGSIAKFHFQLSLSRNP